MSLPALEALIEDELRLARVRLRHELRRSPTGIFVLLWSDVERLEGFGGRVLVHRVEGLRLWAASIGVLVLHSTAPKILYGRAAESPMTLYTSPRCDPAVLRVLVGWAIASTLPTKARLTEAQRRLGEVGIRFEAQDGKLVVVEAA